VFLPDRRSEMTICINCELIPVSRKVNKYCSHHCQQEYQYKSYITSWKLGLEKGYRGKTRQISRHIRFYLLSKFENACHVCGWDKLHPLDSSPLVEINHIDGDAGNCSEENLEVLCPNCHSMTENIRNRNKTI